MIRYFVCAGSTMGSLLPYWQLYSRDRHSLAAALHREQVTAPGDRTAAVAVEGSVRIGDGDRLVEQFGAARGGQDVDRAVGAEQAPECSALDRLLVARRDL